jgi:hypothetical protein
MAIGEWDERQLCPDGACIGVIGPDGTCKTCGRAAPNWGDERKRGLIEPEDQDDDADEDDDSVDDADDADNDDDDEVDGDDDEDDLAANGDAGDGIAAASDRDPTARGDWTVRQLCPDGACIGVIGLDGRCKVCGRTAEGAANERRPAGAAGTDDMAPAAAAPSAEPADAGASAAAQALAAPEAPSPPSPPSPLREFLEGVPATAPAGSAAAAAAGGEPSIDPREPCPDASCKGRIGGDGRCDVCGNGAS